MYSSAQISKAKNYIDFPDNRRLEDFLDHLSDTPTTRPSMSLPPTITRFRIFHKKTKPSILLDIGIERNKTLLQPLGERRTKNALLNDDHGSSEHFPATAQARPRGS